MRWEQVSLSNPGQEVKNMPVVTTQQDTDARIENDLQNKGVRS